MKRLALTTLFLSGCSGSQSVLDTGGAQALEIAALSWRMFAGAALILALICLLTVWAVWAPQERRQWLAGKSAIMIGGIVFPVVVLTALLIDGLLTTARFASQPEAGVRIEVVGEQWWWRVRYLDAEGRPVLETANDIRIPVGEPVAFSLTTNDVLHSFWVPSLAGKLDMIPGVTNVLRLQAQRPGVYRGQCAEYCGGAHALMAFHVEAVAPDAFATWLSQEQQSAKQPAAPAQERGRELFLAAGCGACHTVRGTAATGRLGPDLTHIGRRAYIGAGVLPTTLENLKAWISDNQSIKPHNRMPRFRIFNAEELADMATWLESLQ